MKKFYLKKSFIKKSILFGFVAIFLILAGCYEFKFIIQPSTAEANSSFVVKITMQRPASEDPSADDIFAYAYLGVILPDGWTIKDSIEFTKAGQTEDQAEKDTLVFNADHVAVLEADTMTVPEGYHWWAAKSLSTVNMIGFDTAYVELTILTNDALGEFKLKYVVGDDEGEGSRFPYSDRAISDFIPITIQSPTNVNGLWKNEDWKVYPNPSSGQIFVQQSDLTGKVNLKVFDLNGRVQKQILLNQSNSLIDLHQLPEGNYIVALEKDGKIKSKKIILK